MFDFLTDVIELLALFLIAAGAVAALLPVIGWASLAAGGVVLLGGSLAAQYIQRRRQKPGPQA